MTDKFFDRAVLRIPSDKAINSVRLDPDVRRWFESQGEQYQNLVNQVLRSHIAKISE